MRARRRWGRSVATRRALPALFALPFTLAAIGAAAAYPMAGGSPWGAGKPGTFGTSFDLGGGLRVRLVSYRLESSVRVTHGPLWKPRRGDEIVGASWTLRNYGPHPVRLQSFFALAKGIAHPGRVVAGLGYPMRLLPHEKELQVWHFEMAKGDASARLFYGPDPSVQHAKSVWLIRPCPTAKTKGCP